jgi:hypothetical protein
MSLIAGGQETENQIVKKHFYVEDVSKDGQRFEWNSRKAFLQPGKQNETKKNLFCKIEEKTAKLLMTFDLRNTCYLL